MTYTTLQYEITPEFDIQIWGADPRELESFKLIQNELAKLSHVAQPEISWDLVCEHSISILKKNGFDMQTFAYYALSFLEITGMTELANHLHCLGRLIVDDKKECWPYSSESKIKIFDWFCGVIHAKLRATQVSETSYPKLLLLRDTLNTLNRIFYGEYITDFPGKSRLLMEYIDNLIRQFKSEVRNIQSIHNVDLYPSNVAISKAVIAEVKNEIAVLSSQKVNTKNSMLGLKIYVICIVSFILGVLCGWIIHYVI